MRLWTFWVLAACIVCCAIAMPARDYYSDRDGYYSDRDRFRGRDRCRDRDSYRDRDRDYSGRDYSGRDFPDRGRPLSPGLSNLIPDIADGAIDLVSNVLYDVGCGVDSIVGFVIPGRRRYWNALLWALFSAKVIFFSKNNRKTEKEGFSELKLFIRFFS